MKESTRGLLEKAQKDADGNYKSNLPPLDESKAYTCSECKGLSKCLRCRIYLNS